MKLLGVTLDRHLTFANHIEQVVCKARGLLGILRRACKWLPRGLTLLAYQALIRSHLEYASAMFVGIANTHNEKLERLQRVAARIICGADRDAHAEPLLATLGLKTLASRREERVIDILESIIAGDCHPALLSLVEFSSEAEDKLLINKTRTVIGSRCFSVAGAKLFNERI